MHEAVAKLWPEIQWIEDETLRNQVTQTWVKALERSPLKPDGHMQSYGAREHDILGAARLAENPPSDWGAIRHHRPFVIPTTAPTASPTPKPTALTPARAAAAHIRSRSLG
jgi:hypothetical protein